MDKAVIFHDKCVDGFTSAVIAHKKFPEAKLIPASYGDPVPDLENHQIYIIDFSYSREVLLTLASKNEVVVLDHHKSAQLDLEGLDFCIFDMHRSGAMLAWDYFFPGETAPPLVAYVQDRDLWLWALPDSRAISAAIGSHEFDLQVWTQMLMEPEIDRWRIEGEAILRYQKRVEKEILKEAREVELLGHKVLAVNATTLQSEIANSLAEGREFGIAWQQIQDGSYKYSLRAKTGTEIDVSKLAKEFGGGGHPLASGFKANDLLF